MTHIWKTERFELTGNNYDLVTICGIKHPLPEGDRAYSDTHQACDVFADCPTCNPNPRQLGTPISKLSGRPGEPGYQEFCRIAQSWGHN